MWWIFYGAVRVEEKKIWDSLCDLCNVTFGTRAGKMRGYSKLTMPSWHHLMLCFRRSFCACSLPCIKINKWNIRIWIPQLSRAWRRGRVPSKALAAAVGSHWGLQRCPKARQPVWCLREMQRRRLLSCTVKPAAAWMWFSLGGCTTWVWQLRVASKCVLSNAAGALYKAGRCLFTSAFWSSLTDCISTPDCAAVQRPPAGCELFQAGCGE